MFWRYLASILMIASTLLFVFHQVALADWPATAKEGSKGHEVALAQSVLNEIAGSSLTVDGNYGPATTAAVKAFQTTTGLDADGVVGPMTWKKLFDKTSRYIIAFERGTAPPNKPTTPENDALYECTVHTKLINSNGTSTVTTHRGSVIPSDLNGSGRVKNGWYNLHLGFHKRMGQVPTAADLIVKTNGNLRPCLVVNEDKAVPVESDNPAKTTSTAIHIHNGFNTDRYSDGCQTITPSDWSPFIKHFLDKYPALEDWHKDSSYRGKPIGVLVISGP